MTHQLITKQDFKMTNWTGGQTTELLIYPEESSLAEQNFDFRFSSATVTDKAVFTNFSHYQRRLMLLAGEVELTHHEKEGIRKVKLLPFEQAAFSGDIQTTSIGNCRDFNLIHTSHYSSSLTILRDNMIVIHPSEFVFIYLEKGSGCFVFKEETYMVAENEALFFQDEWQVLTFQEQEPSIVLVSRLKPVQKEKK